MTTTSTTTTAIVLYPAITNAVRSDGTRLPETFGTVRVMRSSETQDHEFAHCSDGSLIITHLHTGEAVRLTQQEVHQLIQEHSNVRHDLH